MRRKLIKMISIALIALTLFGCGAKEDAVVKTDEADTVENESQDVNESSREEVLKEDSEETESVGQTESQSNDETISMEKPEAEVTTKAANLDELVQYMVTLDPTEPAIVIYNEGTGEVINVKDGERYQLRADDRIFVSQSEEVTQCSCHGIISFEDCIENHCVYNTNGMYKLGATIMEGYENKLCGWEFVPDYTKFESGEEVETKWKNYIGDVKKDITVYLTTP